MATMNTRTRDLALLRVLGAKPAALAAVAVTEAGLIAVAAVVLGVLLSAAALAVCTTLLADQTGIRLHPQLDPWLLVSLSAGAAAAAVVAAAFPAFRAAVTPIEEVLQS
jgi:putative ABC transport system permease protein